MMASLIPVRSFYKRMKLHIVIPGSSADSDGSVYGNEDQSTLTHELMVQLLMTTNISHLGVILLHFLCQPQGKDQLLGIGSVPRLLCSNGERLSRMCLV